MDGNKGNMDNTYGIMDNMTRAKICYITGIMTSTSADMTGSQAGNMTGEQTENMTGGEVGSNMTGMGNMTGAKTYYITATMACTPEAITNMTEAQAGNMTENMT